MRLKMIPSISLVLVLGACTIAPTQQPALPSSPLAPVSAPANTDVTATPSPGLEVQINETMSSPTEQHPASTASDDPCDNIYYPVINGASWNYVFTDGKKATHSMSVNPDGTFLITVQGGDTIFYIDGSCTDEGIVLLDQAGSSVTVSDADGTSSIVTTNEDGVSFPDDIQLGDVWSQSISMTDNNMSATIEVTYTAESYEQVKVPAGTFYALKIVQTSTTKMNGDSFDQTIISWAVQNVGVVKSEIVGVDTAELTSYQIP